jgi:predicted neutral ceramidase superfamily lipid hydrolase
LRLICLKWGFDKNHYKHHIKSILVLYMFVLFLCVTYCAYIHIQSITYDLSWYLKFIYVNILSCILWFNMCSHVMICFDSVLITCISVYLVDYMCLIHTCYLEVIKNFLMTFFISIWLYGYYLMLLCFEQHFTLACMTSFWIISYVWIIIVCLCI